MGGVCVAGVGLIPFGKHVERTLVDMGSEAACRALQDAGIEPGRVGLGVFACAAAPRLLGEVTSGQNIFWEVGINRIPIVNVENACSSGSTGFVLAYNAIAAGQVDVALVVGAEKLCIPGVGLLNSGETELDTLMGMVAPASFAMRAARYIHEFGASAAQLASVAVKNRAHAVLNPYAHFREAVTLEEVLSSPTVADPLTRMQCCPISDGAAAVVLCSQEEARRRCRTVGVKAAILCTGSYGNPADLGRWETDYRGCNQGYEAAGIGPEDLHVVECHDAFTIAEILHYEALGLCGPGEGANLAVRGETRLGGRIPVNVSGGLIGRGHPAGATGLAQVYEIVTQLRGEGEGRQVQNAKVGLAHCMGGDKDGDTKSFTMIVLVS